jgi:FKBP-type peptidyl-prolyl cis-trans isomerase SlyD
MIKKDTVVSMGYNLKNSEGEELGNADANQPLTYLQGAGQIVPGLENALEGLVVGDKKDVTISPKEGYGEVSAELRLKVERKLFPPDAEIKPGMQFKANTGDDHERTFTVVELEDDHVKIDGNHPLAGQTLYFNVEIVAIREATKDELTHGHAHGADGTHKH